MQNWVSPFDPAGLQQELDTIEKAMQEPDFWNDNENAAKVMQNKKSLERKLDAYNRLNSDCEDLEVMMEMADEEEDESLIPEIESDFRKLKKNIDDMRVETLLTGEYDRGGAILGIHSGAGGAEAQDWANMLLRMYTRWFERKDYKYTIIDLQTDDDNGIKSATLTVQGENAYGYLKNESGVHRLVRISPFDSNARRHTSFASVDVTPQIDDDIEVEINPEDLRIDTYRSSGAGGQHVNTTDSAVRITHIPTNIVVSCQNERSQHQNREVAMRVLKSRLIELKERENKEKIDELRGDYGQITWGNQIRSYVFQPYTMVKDHRTGAEVGDVQKVMDGDIDYFINEKLKKKD